MFEWDVYVHFTSLCDYTYMSTYVYMYMGEFAQVCGEGLISTLWRQYVHEPASSRDPPVST